MDLRTRPKNLILNHYEQVGERGKAVGEGASGIVIKAKDTQGNQDYVAIKRPNPMLSLVERRKKSAQIKRESEALKQLDHDAACHYIDDGDWQNLGDHFLVIAWASGEPVEDRLRHLERLGKPLPLGEVLEISIQLADLLVHAHRQGVIHNDLDAKHLFWDVEGPHPQLRVIDWANCALASDAKPIATVADDLHQYGELMHRLLTGSTVAYATRLGGEDNWQVEMAEKKIPESLQGVVARAIGRVSRAGRAGQDEAGQDEGDSNASYDTIDELHQALQKYRQIHDEPIRKKVPQINQLLDQNTLDSLDQAEGLIDQVSTWNPALVFRQQRQLQKLRRERVEKMARIGGKTSLLAEQWSTACDEIMDVFGPDPRKMPQVEERYIYLLGDLMDKLPPGSEQYTLGKQVVAELLKQNDPDEDIAPDEDIRPDENIRADEDIALDKILRLYGANIPDDDPLIEELSRQTGRLYPLRNRNRKQFN